MKYKFIKVFLIMFLSVIMIGSKNTFATKITGLDVKLFSRAGTLSEGQTAYDVIEPSVLENLNKMGYDGNRLNDEMKIKTTITIIEKRGDTYYIKFEKMGKTSNEDDEDAYEPGGGLSAEELKNIYGYPEDQDVNVGESWDALLIIKSNVTYDDDLPMYAWQGMLEEIYTGDDIESGTERETNDERIPEYTYNESDIASDGGNFVDDFLKDWIGTIVTYFSRFICKLADGLQWIANSVQYNESNSVLYTFEELKEDKTKDKYTKVAEGESGRSVVTKTIQNDANADGDLDFDKSVEIPVMVGDIYNIAVDHISFFDFNFLTGQNAKNKDGTVRHESGSAWMILRDIVATFIRISIYVASAILIITLIIFGIKTTKGTINDPKKKAEDKKMLEKLKNSLLMLVASILVMAICIFLTKALYQDIVKEDSYELPIRVRVQDTYSFSTTYAGYLRYVTLNKDVSSNWGRTALYTLLYVVVVIANLIAICIMLVRTLLMWGLSMWGPFIAVQNVFGKEVKAKFGRWAFLYFLLAFAQMVLVVFTKMLLNIV